MPASIRPKIAATIKLGFFSSGKKANTSTIFPNSLASKPKPLIAEAAADAESATDKLPTIDKSIPNYDPMALQ